MAELLLVLGFSCSGLRVKGAISRSVSREDLFPASVSFSCRRSGDVLSESSMCTGLFWCFYVADLSWCHDILVL